MPRVLGRPWGCFELNRGLFRCIRESHISYATSWVGVEGKILGRLLFLLFVCLLLSKPTWRVGAKLWRGDCRFRGW